MRAAFFLLGPSPTPGLTSFLLRALKGQTLAYSNITVEPKPRNLATGRVGHWLGTQTHGHVRTRSEGAILWAFQAHGPSACVSLHHPPGRIRCPRRWLKSLFSYDFPWTLRPDPQQWDSDCGRMGFLHLCCSLTKLSVLCEQGCHPQVFGYPQNRSMWEGLSECLLKEKKH